MARREARLPEIERLRGVAILMVMSVHLYPVGALLPTIARASWSGVDLFFVISGYVVARSLLGVLPPLASAPSFLDALAVSRDALCRFYVRRFFRIMPAAVATLAIAWLCAGRFPEHFGSRASWATQAVAFLGGGYNFWLPYHRGDHALGPLWSLSVEEHFYLVLPLLFVAFRTSSGRLGACLVLALVSALGRALPVPDGADPEFYLKFTSYLRFDSLMAGVALALVSTDTVRAPLMPPALMRWGILPLALVLIGCLPSSLPAQVAHRVGLTLLAALSGLVVYFAALDRSYVLAVPGLSRGLEYVGSRSYSLYLTHLLVGKLEDAERAFCPRYARLVPSDVATPWQRALVVLLGALLAAEVLHLAIERPFVSMGRRLLHGEIPPSRLATSGIHAQKPAPALSPLPPHPPGAGGG